MNRRNIFTIALTLLAAAAVISPTVLCEDAAVSADTSFEPTYYDAEVTPFTFPESKGTPILTALSAAESTIDIAVYYLGSEDIVALLCDLEEKENVDVRVIVPGNALGIDIEDEISRLKELVACGGEVNIINYKDCDDKRYSFFHNKYAVIDNDTVIITSENWTGSNMSSKGNRGWGAIIESTGYAGYMESIFESDFSAENGDVKSVSDAYPDIEKSGDLTYTIPSGYPTVTYTAKVAPVNSPQNSKTALTQFIDSATERIYVEQLDIDDKNAALTGDTLIAKMSQKAEFGVDVKYILNGTYETGADKDAGDHHSLIQNINENTKIRAAVYEKTKAFPQIHNKGVIVDDRVWVGSVNWTESSFNKNRETAVIIDSEEVTDYYLGYFNTDFSNTYTVDCSKEGHNLIHRDAVPASCTADGNIEYYFCSNCKKNFADEVGTAEAVNVSVSKTAHTMSHHSAAAASLFTDGNVEYYSCSECGKNFADESGSAEIEDVTVAKTGDGLLYYIAAAMAAIFAAAVAFLKKSARKAVRSAARSGRKSSGKRR